jgi:trimethylamine-N-oxide reductase cytochrome c-type subunit TorC
MHPAMAAGNTCIACHNHELPDTVPAGPVAAGSPAYTVATTPLFLDPNQTGGAGEGSLLPASRVEVVETSGSLVRVKIAGWQQQGVDRAIYARQGQRILNGVLNPPAIAKLEQGSAQTGAKTGIAWRQVALAAWVPATSLTGDSAVLWSVASIIYSAHCGTCHALPAPTSHLANEWPGMASPMQQRSALNDQQYRLVLKYLQLHAKDTAEANG